MADQFSRCCGGGRRSASREALIEAAPAAAADTVGVAVRGYSEAPRSETVLFNLLGRLPRLLRPGPPLDLGDPRRLGAVPQRQRRRPPHPPLRARASCSPSAPGTAALLTDDDELEQHLAIPMGAGIGLTFDEAALLLDLRDVYWTREGLLSVQLSLGATAILSIAILTLRMLRRGERRQEQEGLIPPGRTTSSPPELARWRNRSVNFFPPAFARKPHVAVAPGLWFA